MANRVDAEHPLRLRAAVVDDEVEPSVYGQRQLVDIACDEVGFQYLGPPTQRQVAPGGAAELGAWCLQGAGDLEVLVVIRAVEA
jgi:hypothetical protein